MQVLEPKMLSVLDSRMQVACKELGFDDCTYLSRGDTVDAIYTAIRSHFQAVHRFNERRFLSSEVLPNSCESSLYLKVASIARAPADSATERPKTALTQ
jgi:hypothetical protein